MSNWTQNPNGTEENGFQKSLYKVSKLTFIDLCKSYIIALIVFLFLGVLADTFWGNIILQILLLIGFGYPLYCNAWGEGYHDLNRFEFGRITKDKFRGFKFGIIALIPSFLITFILLISYLTGGFELMFIYRFANIHAIPILNSIVSPDILTVDYNILQMLAYIIIPPVITVAFIGTGYYLGFSDIAVLDKVVYKKNVKDKIK